MRKPLPAARGHLHHLDFDSVLLQGNAPGDPTRRPLLVYTPPDYDTAQHYPLLMDLVGYTGTGRSHSNWKPFGLNLVERLDWLISTQGMAPAVVVLPDCFTAYGGNQYINSTATGPYMDYLLEEILPFVEQEFAAGGSPAKRGVFGKSSGGYGAFVHGMTRTDAWGAFASHSGDAYFAYCFIPEFPTALRMLAKYEESPAKFLDAIWAREKLTGDEVNVLMTLGMAAHYDPDPSVPLGFHLPFDLHTGQMDWERWKHWTEWDSVSIASRSTGAMQALRGIYFDCGTKDQYNLLYGNRMIHQILTNAGLVHEYHEFDDDHSDVDYRMNISLPWMSGLLTS